MCVRVPPGVANQWLLRTICFPCINSITMLSTVKPHNKDLRGNFLYPHFREFLSCWNVVNSQSLLPIAKIALNKISDRHLITDK